MSEEQITLRPAPLFKLKKSVRGSCQAMRCRGQHVLEIEGDLWRVETAKLCEAHAEEAAAFAEANPDYVPPQTVFTPEEKADLMHLRDVAETIKLDAREGLDVLGIIRNFEIKTQMDLVRANEWLHDVVEKRAEIAEKEKFVVDPIKLSLTRLGALFRPNKQYWADAEIVLRRKIELSKMVEIERNEAAMQKAADASAVGDDAGAQLALSEVAHVSELKGTTITDAWEFEIEDEAQLPREYMRPDLGLIKIYVNRALREGFVPAIKGIKFTKSAKSIVRRV